MSDDSSRLYTTHAGLRRLEERVAASRQAYLTVCASNGEAAGAGDSSVWHDNFAYEENQRQMHQLARRVTELEAQLCRMRIVPAAHVAPARVRVGCCVLLTFLDDDSTRGFFIAGYGDGDPGSGRLSYSTPLARAVLGAEEGDERTLSHGGRQRRVEISGISPAPVEELAAS